MNRTVPVLKPEKLVTGFLQYKTAQGLSPNTLVNYEHDLKLWLSRIGDTEIEQVTAESIRDFLAWLRTEYKPQRLTGKDHPLSPKTIRNVWITFCAFFRWAGTEFGILNPMKDVPAPKFEKAPIEPFTKEEIERLLKAVEFCKEAQTDRRRKFTMRRTTARRDRAIILFLTDTGLRASEFCSLKIGDFDHKTGRIAVKHGVLGGAKGGKGRTVYIGKATRSALWRYLAGREEDGEDPNAPLFIGKFNRPMTKTTLRELMAAIGQHAGVNKCHPHKFRHTFAITYLRSGGDVFTLQSLLGHSSLEMVQHYARIAEMDVEQAHRRASPADNWHL